MAKKRKPKVWEPEQEHVQQTVIWIAEGNRQRQIIEGLHEEFELTLGQALTTIEAAEHSIDDGANEGLSLSWLLEATREVHRRAMEANELTTALRALEKMERINQEIQDEEDL